MKELNNIELNTISGGDEDSYNAGTSVGQFLGETWNAIGEAWNDFEEYMTRVGNEMKTDEPYEPAPGEGFGTI